jgi:replicative DNA helicase
MADNASPTAEQSVIGGLILDNGRFDEIGDRIRPEDFYRPAHRILFEAIGELIEASVPVDALTLSEHLEARGRLQAVGGMAYIGSLAKNTPSAANVAAYANRVRELAIERRLRKASMDIVDTLGNGSLSTPEKVERAQALVMDIETDRAGAGLIHVKECLEQCVDEIDSRYQRQDAIPGLPTGYSDIDSKLLGLQPGNLCIIAARPSVGKSTLAQNIAEHVAIRDGGAVAFFSLEMSRHELTDRMVSSLGRVNLKALRTGDIAEEDWPRITSAISLLAAAPLFLDETGGIDLHTLATRCRRHKRQHGLGLVIVDYLQLMRARGENRNQEISQLSAGLKRIAKDLSVPVIALSQLNRESTKRPDKRPTLADIRDSGAVEQDADIVLMLHRDEEHKGIAEVNIAKNRNGETGRVTLTWIGQYCRFENCAHGNGFDFDPPPMKGRYRGGFDAAEYD